MLSLQAASTRAWRRRTAAGTGIAVQLGPFEIDVEQDSIVIRTSTGRHLFDTVYPSLGSDTKSELALGVEAMVSDEGCICVDTHQRTKCARLLYAAGDVVIGLDQMRHEMGLAGVAATTIAATVVAATSRSGR